MSEYVSITELGQEDENHAIRWAFTMPPSIDAERIVLNVDRLNTFHRIGGIATSIIYDYQGERTEYTPGIAGINNDGTALASKTGTMQKAEETSTRTQDLLPAYIERQYGSVLALHGINKAELASTISDKVRNGKTNREKLWADQLDHALRSSFRLASKDNLITKNPLFTKAIDSFWVSSGLMAYTTDTLNGHFSAWDSIYPGVWGLVLSTQLVFNRLTTGSTLIHQRRWSLAPNGFQPDRYLASVALSHMHGLIKAL